MTSMRESELRSLRALTARVGRDPLLTQGSTGNSSLKLGDSMWIKASGKWMADAWAQNIFISVDLAEVRRSVCLGLDPAERFAGASIETAMHAALPHRAVIHLHSVDAIAFAVRKDGLAQLQ